MPILRRRLAAPLAAILLGASLAAGLGACGDEERKGGVEVEGGTTGTTGTAPSTVEQPATVEEAPPETSTTP